MPSLKRPNAPARLPSDSPIFRAKRTEGSSHFTTSTALISPFSGSPLSPLTHFEQRQASRQERRGSRLHLSPSGISTSTALDYIAPGVSRRGSAARGRHDSQGSEKSESHSARSSISVKARKLLKLPGSRRNGSTTKEDEPPREARKGFFWRYEVSGHWLEIRLGERRPSENSPQASQTTMNPWSAPPTPSNTNETMSKAEKMMGMGVQPSPKVPKRSFFSPPATTGQFEGLYERTKKRLGIRNYNDHLPAPHLTQRSKTGEVLERTSSKLRLYATKQGPVSGTTSVKTVSSHNSSTRSVTLPKWQRLMGETVRGIDSSSSNSSSQRSAIQGRPPEPTPELEEMYTGSNKQQYFRTEMTDVGGPNFLPSEARRVNTPPIGASRGKARGFFFDYKPPELNEAPFRGRMSRQTTLGIEDLDASNDQIAESRKMSVLDSTTEWYNVQLDAIDANENSLISFVSEVPDHLANSPLCPRHPKNKSGGKGTCSLHGRTGTDVSDRTGTESRDSDDVYCGGQTHRVEY